MTRQACAGVEGAGETVRLRRACPEDASSLAALAAETFSGAYRHVIPAEDMAAYVARTFAAAAVLREIRDPGSLVLVAEGDGTPLGYLKALAGAATAGVGGAQSLQLERLYVCRDGLGGGIGTRLLGAMLDHALAEGVDLLWLRVWDGNHGAIRFYRRHGFRGVGLEPYLVGNTEKQVLVMVRPVVSGAPGVP